MEVDNSQFAVGDVAKTSLQDLASHILDERDRRHWYFPAAMFDEAPWQMLLILYASDARRLSSESLSSTVLAPPSTGSRWIDYLETEGLVTRHAEPSDETHSMVELAPKGLTLLELYLNDRFQRAQQWNKQTHVNSGNASSRILIALAYVVVGALAGGLACHLTARHFSL